MNFDCNGLISEGMSAERADAFQAIVARRSLLVTNGAPETVQNWSKGCQSFFCEQPIRTYHSPSHPTANRNQRNKTMSM